MSSGKQISGDEARKIVKVAGSSGSGGGGGGLLGVYQENFDFEAYNVANSAALTFTPSGWPATDFTAVGDNTDELNFTKKGVVTVQLRGTPGGGTPSEYNLAIEFLGPSGSFLIREDTADATDGTDNFRVHPVATSLVNPTDSVRILNSAGTVGTITVNDIYFTFIEVA